jgi:hypothetical protein
LNLKPGVGTFEDGVTPVLPAVNTTGSGWASDEYPVWFQYSTRGVRVWIIKGEYTADGKAAPSFSPRYLVKYQAENIEWRKSKTL